MEQMLTTGQTVTDCIAITSRSDINPRRHPSYVYHKTPVPHRAGAFYVVTGQAFGDDQAEARSPLTVENCHLISQSRAQLGQSFIVVLDGLVAFARGLLQAFNVQHVM